ncbi:xanthine dehydrogenase YagS FAD-binding subunit [Azospirillum oryzae]|uniref:Xanthine dehydrogenase YagS FAD-binding subunit n=1 Tax=Azospirillum oryzae TaxID=286727 RepID=A0A1X7FJU0_9PROT|nr:xanthine dehydrogenase family protein subunit M [Azospirillum oryzae]SMF53410.1 xanthine dehydrogenase YagS FAD-binding subunit [Azospirillum oryzae]
MRPFQYERADTLEGAVKAAGTGGATQFIAGGTTLSDLMKLDVMRPERLVDVNPAAGGPAGRIEATKSGLRLGAMVRMAEAAEHPAVKTDYPVIAQALQLAASQQIRNMASLGGNLLQRTRCEYFRQVSWPCNKREPGSGCAAMDGVNRLHAVLGTSDACIASYPGDFAQALVALDAVVETVREKGGARRIALSDLHRPPGDTPQVETVLEPGELITAITVPAGPWTRRSLYLKIRDRDSYAFALASAAVALDLDGEVVREARIALGGIATVPWRAREAEAALRGKTMDEAAATAAAEAALAGAQPRGDNAFKVPLAKQTIVRALMDAKRMET